MEIVIQETDCDDDFESAVGVQRRLVRSVRKSKCHDRVPQPGAQPCVAARIDNDILPPVPFMAHRRRLSACREPASPQRVSGLDIKCAQEIIHCRADKYAPACGDNGTTKIRCAELHARHGRQVLRCSEWFSPGDFPAREINARYYTPGRWGAGQVEQRQQSFSFHTERCACLWRYFLAPILMMAALLGGKCDLDHQASRWGLLPQASPSAASWSAWYSFIKGSTTCSRCPSIISSSL